MPTQRIDAVEANELIRDGITVIDVLPASIFRQEHLPGAVNIPLETFEPGQLDRFERADPLIVYCFDQHCDLSARATARFDRLGFEQVNDLIGGRAAWTALGLPTEGEVGDRRRISHHLSPVASVPVDATIDSVAELGSQQLPVALLDEHGILLGALDPAALGLPGDTRVEDAMVPAPGTIRPELRVDEVVAQLRRDGLEHVFVTSVDGVLLGRVVVEELHV
jgi:rhodanese-related sulfurtransferase